MSDEILPAEEVEEVKPVADESPPTGEAAAEAAAAEETVAEEVSPDPILVNGIEVAPATIAEEERELRRRYEEAGETKSDEDILEDATQNAIERVLLRQEALKTVGRIPRNEIDKAFNKVLREHGGRNAFYARYPLTEEDEENVREDLANRIRVERFIGQITADIPAPSEEEIAAFYGKNSSFFVEPEAVHAGHIMLSTKNGPADQLMLALLNLRATILEQDNFAEIARRHAGDDSWDLGWIPRGMILPAFEEAVFALQPGEISDVVKTSSGLHIATVIERRERKPVSLASARKDIRERLWNQTKNDVVGTLVDKLRESAEIVRP